MAGTLVRDLRANLDMDPTGFEKGSKSAAASAKVFEQALKEQEQAAKRHQDQMDKLGTVALGVGGALVAGFGLAVGAAMDFDKQMSAVGAASNATAADMDKLRQAALQAGKDTAFSATEAAEAQTELAKAGVTTADILGGALKGALSLAAAGQLDLGRAAEISAQAMATFNLKGKDVGHIADVLSAGANKSTADVETLAQALQQGGLVASQMGLSLEETVGTLAAFDQNALKGSDAGTSFKTMLSRLVMPEVAASMKELNIQAFDAQGNFVGMADFAGQLQGALGGMTQEQRNATMYTLFGSDAIRAANIVYKLGEKGVQDWTTAVDQQGAASQTASKLTDNLAGDLEKLKGALETALIEGGSGATSALRGLTQAATGAVDIFGQLPGPVQSTITVVGGIAGAVTAAAGAFVLGAPKVAEFKDALSDMGPRGQKFGDAITSVGSFLAGPWGVAIGAAAVGLGFFAAKHAEAQAKVAELTEAIKADSGALGENTRAKVVNRLESDGLLEIAQRLGIDLKLVTEAALGNAGALAQVNAKLAEGAGPADAFHTKVQSLADGTKVLSGDQMVLQTALQNVNGDLAESVESYKRTEGASQGAATGTEGAGSAMQGMGQKADVAARSVDDLRKELDDLTGAAYAAISADIAYQQAIDDVSAALKDNGHTHDTNTEAGRKNMGALADLARTANEYRLSQIEQQAPMSRVSALLEDQRRRFIDTAVQMGHSRQKAEELADKLGLIPQKVDTRVSTPGADESKRKADDVRNAVNGIPSRKDVTIFVKSEFQDDLSRDALRQAGGMADGGILRFADGGVTGFAGGSEHHIAQIASPGMIRVWNEPETAGEAYIPLASSKRPRSEAILSQVADQFGGMFVKRPMAAASPSGGYAGSPSGGNHYSITLQVPPNANMAQIGALTVGAIQEYERRSGTGWRR